MKHFATSKAVFLVATSTVLVDCGEPFVFSPEGVSGTYILEAVNGKRLPAKSVEGALCSAGSVTLNADGTFFRSMMRDGNTVKAEGPFYLEQPDSIRLGRCYPSLSSWCAIVHGTLIGDKLTIIEYSYEVPYGDFDTFLFRK